MTSALRARAAVVAERAPLGGTRLTTLRSDPPIALRPAAGALYLAASAAGPLGGDAVALDLTVGPGAALEVRSVGASLALPGVTPAESTGVVDVAVGTGGHLRWLVEPTILARGCDHRTEARIQLAEGATLVWREEAVLGRAGEAGGSVRQRLRIDRAGRPLLRSEHAAGPRWPGSTGPAGTAGHRALGTLVVVGPAARRVLAAATDGAGAALVAPAELADDAVVLIALAASARRLRETLDATMA